MGVLRRRGDVDTQGHHGCRCTDKTPRVDTERRRPPASKKGSLRRNKPLCALILDSHPQIWENTTICCCSPRLCYFVLATRGNSYGYFHRQSWHSQAHAQGETSRKSKRSTTSQSQVKGCLAGCCPHRLTAHREQGLKPHLLRGAFSRKPAGGRCHHRSSPAPLSLSELQPHPIQDTELHSGRFGKPRSTKAVSVLRPILRRDGPDGFPQ